MICRCQIMNSKHSQHITSTAAQAPSHGGGRRAPAALGGIPWGGVRAAVYPAASTGFDVHVALRIGLTMKSGSAAPGRCRARPDADGHPKPPGMPTLSCWSSSETGALHPPAQAEAPPGGRRLPARGASLWGSACIWARVRDHIRQARGPGPGDGPDSGRAPSGTPTPATRALGCLMSGINCRRRWPWPFQRARHPDVNAHVHPRAGPDAYANSKRSPPQRDGPSLPAAPHLCCASWRSVFLETQARRSEPPYVGAGYASSTCTARAPYSTPTATPRCAFVCPG